MEGPCRGPSGPSVVRLGAGDVRLAFHAWGPAAGYGDGGIRALWIDRLRVAGGVPAAF